MVYLFVVFFLFILLYICTVFTWRFFEHYIWPYLRKKHFFFVNFLAIFLLYSTEKLLQMFKNLKQNIYADLHVNRTLTKIGFRLRVTMNQRRPALRLISIFCKMSGQKLDPNSAKLRFFKNYRSYGKCCAFWSIAQTLQKLNVN